MTFEVFRPGVLEDSKIVLYNLLPRFRFGFCELFDVFIQQFSLLFRQSFT